MLPCRSLMYYNYHPRFNSSGATIIPDSSTRSTQLHYREYNPVSGLSNARLLMPEDSFGRQLNEFMADIGDAAGGANGQVGTAHQESVRRRNNAEGENLVRDSA